MKTLTQILVAAMNEAERHLLMADAEAARLAAESALDVSQLRRSIETATNRINRALLFQRVLSGDVTLGYSPVPVSYLLEDTMLECRLQLPADGPVVEVIDNTDAVWPMDRELVIEVLYNAVLSAARHTASRLRLTATESDEMLVLSIEDDGPGFSCLDESSFHERGYGLYVAQQLAGLHVRHGRQGRAIVRNGDLAHGELGGAVFELRLP